jgi:hypothetical protein
MLTFAGCKHSVYTSGMTTRTYSFRADPALGAEIREAIGAWEEFAARGGDDPERLDELWRSFAGILVRHVNALDEPKTTDSALIRACLEAFVAATNKTVEEMEHLSAYAEWAREDEEAQAVRQGAAVASSGRWQDE